MSLPKALNEIRRDLEAIKAKLGIVEDAPLEPPKPPAVPEPESPDAVAARIDYDSYTAQEVVERADSLTDDERAALLNYEAANKNRATVLRAMGA